jgi:tRNA A37 threonylcarbamoyladenosine modification protein TsaB
MQIGLYKEGKLFEVKEYEGQTSDILLPILQDIIKKHKVLKIIYTSGPGSHMATKIAYVLLKTVSLIKNIPIFAISAFDLNENKPIKALGKLYFIKEKENIITKKFDIEQKTKFFIPKELSSLNILKNNEPNYHIGAV